MAEEFLMSEELGVFVAEIERGNAVGIHGVGRYEEWYGETNYVHASVETISAEHPWEQFERDFWELGPRVSKELDYQKKNGAQSAFWPF